jgi:hypothetical protein
VSIEVALADLPGVVAEFPFAYLVTVADDGRARVLAVAPEAVDGRLVVADAGRSAPANAAARPAVTLVFPPATPAGMSLLVDGDATVEGPMVTITPTWAVRHRPAVR